MTTPKPKRVAFFATVDWYFCHHYLGLACAVRDAGFIVSVITGVEAHGERIRSEGLDLIPFEVSRKGMNPLRELAVVGRLVQVLRDLRPDLLHNIAQKPVLYGTVAARVAGVPAVVNAITGMGYLFTSSEPRAQLGRRLLGRAYRALLTAPNVQVLVQNPDDQGEILRLTGVAPILVPGSGVDLGRFVPTPDGPGPVLVVLASRMLSDKGVGEFVAAARILKSRGSTARFVLVGQPDPGNPTSVAEDQLRSWQQEGYIEWWGFRGDMPEILGQAHIACLPSYREGLPKFLIEAAAAGLPLVTTDVPGCRAVVTRERNGFLVPPRDPAPLAAALDPLLRDQALRQRFGEQSRLRAQTTFADDRIFAMILGVYRTLVGHP